MNPVFEAEVHQNPHLPARGTVVDAIVSISAATAAIHTPSAAQVIMIDCSSSMTSPPGKLAEAKRATITAIDSLRDGVAFALIAGREHAEVIWPLTPATPQTRAEARDAVSRLTAGGGTAIGSWLRTTGNLLLNHHAEVKHAIMLTDGRNEHESPRELYAALRSCERQFVCDARGVGDGWSGTELRLIASALLGTADGLPHPIPPGRRFPGDDPISDEQVSRRGGATVVDPRRVHRAIRQTGIPAPRGPDRPPQ